MRIYLMTDMEGVCGIINHDDWVKPQGRYYEQGKELLTREINAALEGFFEAGASEVLVADGHGAGGIAPALLDPRALFLSGPPDPYPFGLDATFHAIAFVGQHAKAGTEFAHLPHTGWFNVLDQRINGVSVGEFGEIAMMGAEIGIPCVFGSGDEAFCGEARALCPGIEAVPVKRGLTPGSGNEYDTEGYRNRNRQAIHQHPERARRLIREGAARAAARFARDPGSFAIPDVRPPYRREVDYRADRNKPAGSAWAEHPDSLPALLNMPLIAAR